jgi:hypothetical protein
VTPAAVHAEGVAISRVQRGFLGLVVAQTAHSIEEYTFRLYDTFPPARLLSGLVSDDRARGFLAINVALVAFGFWCVLVPVRRRSPAAAGLMWTWVGIELVNGIGHPLWSVVNGGYTPGVATAPVLLVLAIALARRLAAWPRPV